MPNPSLTIRSLFALCLLVATANHLHAVIEHGWLWDYGYGATTVLPSRLFWGGLTLLDPIAVVLLFIRPNTGIALTAAIIVVDVIHNSFYVASYHQWLEPFYISQVAFLVAVLVLAPIAWNRTVADSSPARSAGT